MKKKDFLGLSDEKANEKNKKNWEANGLQNEKKTHLAKKKQKK